jgi:adenylate cyclase
MKALVSLFSKVQQIGADPRDGENEILQKQVFVSAISLVMVATTLWGITYLVFGEPLAGMLSIGYAVFTLASLLVIRMTRRVGLFLYSQLVLGLCLPFVHTFVLGGFAASSAVVLWALISPLAAIFVFQARRAVYWALAYLLLLAGAGLLQPFGRQGNNLSPGVMAAFFVMNFGGVSAIATFMLIYFQQQRNEAYRLLRIEQEKGENLLLNILPKDIAEILKNESRTIAESFAGVSILFADLVEFTPLTARMAPVEMVNLLNQIFSYFDELVDKYGVEKIRTIGDNYMVAAGVPRPHPDHARALAHMALDAQDYICTLPSIQGRKIRFRIGINSGPVVGGVIGRKKFVYDIWGEAVNIASRMESHGEAGMIQISQTTYELIRADFNCELRGTMDIKGCGLMDTWFLVGRKAQTMENYERT